MAARTPQSNGHPRRARDARNVDLFGLERAFQPLPAKPCRCTRPTILERRCHCFRCGHDRRMA